VQLIKISEPVRIFEQYCGIEQTKHRPFRNWSQNGLNCFLSKVTRVRNNVHKKRKFLAEKNRNSKTQF
jgi:hypothetical protein